MASVLFNISPVARQIPFDNSVNGFVSDNTQGAIEEVDQKIITSASPGFSFGRSSVTNAGTYLQNETVPSNISGRWVYINNATVVNVYVTNELTTTFSITVSYHNGNGAGETDLGTVVITSAKGGAVPVSWPVPTNTQIAVKVALSTANSPKNIVVGLALSGTN